VSEQLITGSLWRDRRPEADKEWLKTHRRVVEVKHPGSPVMSNDRVTGISFWQALREGEWVEIRGRRHTSILRLAFLSKFEHVRGPEASA
jgi:hypothetical protein